VVADGSQLVFHNDLDGDIYVMNSDGSGLTDITNSPTTTEDGTAWSPDGLRIVFAAGGIWTMDPNGANLVGVAEALVAHPLEAPPE
jgi:Tol biopolymer transport system component